MDFEAVDAGVVLVSPIVVHLQLHVTEGILTGVLRERQLEHMRLRARVNLKSTEEILRSRKEVLRSS